jgi:hypothetical protein
MSRAQRRRIEREQAKADCRAAKRAVALERRIRQHDRWSSRSSTSLLGLTGEFLWHLAWAPLAIWLWPLAQIGRLMGIDTSETGPPRHRPAWMPAPDQGAVAARERDDTHKPSNR